MTAPSSADKDERASCPTCGTLCTKHQRQGWVTAVYRPVAAVPELQPLSGDTPRTDANIERCGACGIPEYVDAKFASQLERRYWAACASYGGEKVIRKELERELAEVRKILAQRTT